MVRKLTFTSFTLSVYCLCVLHWSCAQSFTVTSYCRGLHKLFWRRSWGARCARASVLVWTRSVWARAPRHLTRSTVRARGPQPSSHAGCAVGWIHCTRKIIIWVRLAHWGLVQAARSDCIIAYPRCDSLRFEILWSVCSNTCTNDNAFGISPA